MPARRCWQTVAALKECTSRPMMLRCNRTGVRSLSSLTDTFGRCFPALLQDLELDATLGLMV